MSILVLVEPRPIWGKKVNFVVVVVVVVVVVIVSGANANRLVGEALRGLHIKTRR